MLFNSYEFLYAFLPVVCAAFWLSKRVGDRAGVVVLGIASIFFYTYWSLSSLPILVGSMLVNYVAGQKLNEVGASPQARKRVFVAGIVFNLLLISYFKYGAFIIGNVSVAFEAVGFSALAVPHPALPIGISFFTFTQIAYLVDSYKGVGTKTSVDRYSVFVMYFPHLVAGPVLHYRQLLPQLTASNINGASFDRFGLGLFIFAFGLAKKVLIADTLAPIADAGFDAVHAGEMLGPVEGWVSCFAYTFQIYFDFSGYSDMAVGISLFFGIFLPVNFASPYRATSIIEFWRRWHISLSVFLRDYVYIPLGGNRLGRFRRYLNVLATMLVGGLWHGANWTFILWGLAHGVFLAANHFIREILPSENRGRLFKCTGWLVTFFCVSVAWVLFRAESIHGALEMYRTMFNFSAGAQFLRELVYSEWTFTGELLGRAVPGYALNQVVPIIGIALALCLLTAPIVEVRSGPVPLGSKYIDAIKRSPVVGIAAVVVTAFAIYVSTLLMSRVTAFLYFQF